MTVLVDSPVRMEPMVHGGALWHMMMVQVITTRDTLVVMYILMAMQPQQAI